MSEYLETYGLRAVLPISPERAHIGSQATPGNIPMNVLPLSSVLPTGESNVDPSCPRAWLQEYPRGDPKTVIVLTWTLVACGMKSI